MCLAGPVTTALLAPLIRAGVSGAALAAALDGAVVHEEQAGHLATWQSAEQRLPQDRLEQVRPTTLFDLASVTKLYTAAVVLRLVDEGALALDDPAAKYVPGLGAGEEVTLRHLLTHTSGLPSVTQWQAWPEDVEQRWNVVRATGREAAVGARHEYSCVGYLVTTLVLRAVTGARLPELVDRFITGPMGLRDTMFHPGAEDRTRCAATEHQSQNARGMVQGVVHDEASWKLGGEGGNAGLFATAGDVLRFGEMLRCGGEDPATGRRILSESAVGEMARQQLPDGVEAEFGQGIGLRLGNLRLGGRSSHESVGHGGFTGTALVIDRDLHRTTVLLTNAVHPLRERLDVAPLRCELLDHVRALG